MSEPLYRIIDGSGYACGRRPWASVLRAVRYWRGRGAFAVVHVERET